MRTSVELRKKNVLDILKLIVQYQPVTKNDVAVRTGLTIVTINTVINELIQKRIIIEDGNAASIGGRPASLYKINSSRNYLIGVNIGIGEFSFQISNLSMENIYTSHMKIENEDQFKDFFNKFKFTLRKSLESLNIEKNDILGIGVTVPGLVDRNDGIVKFLPNAIGWENIQLKNEFEREFKIKTILEKDTYASVLCVKKQFGPDTKNAIVLILKGGIGSGILLDGNIYRGENGVAGEIGHISLEMNGPKCKCGGEGCLEVFASDFAIANEVLRKIDDGRKCMLNVKSAKEKEMLDISHIILAAQQGDMLCRQVFVKAAGYVGTAISNIIKAYDPEYVFIESNWIKQVDGMFDEVVDVSHKKTALLQKNSTNIVINKEEDLYLKGAVMIVQDYFMESINDNKLLE
jgi:predicted NBD/HSP70 family sugar kinase